MERRTVDRDDAEASVSMLFASYTDGRPETKELEPVITYRGHTAPVTCVVVSSAHNAIFSSSFDSTIRVWKLPNANTESYGQYDPSTSIQTLEGHTDAVWDMVLIPSRDGSRINKKEDRLVSISADGSLKVWKSDGKFWSLLASHSFDGVTPTCLSLCHHEQGKVFVGFTNGLAKLWDVEKGEESLSFGEASDGEFGSINEWRVCLMIDASAQVNAILGLQMIPALVVGHEDGHIRVYDPTEGELLSKEAGSELI